ncbi:MAG TPA: PAN domain-containing protein [Nitrosarchaeum sp.]|nr:PAN domain-containing protein [Nitrosarchaeum sp.]
MNKVLFYVAAAGLLLFVVYGVYMIMKKSGNGEGPYHPPTDPMDNYTVKYDYVERNLLPNEDRDLGLFVDSSPHDCAAKCNASDLCDAFVFNPMGAQNKIPGSVDACVLKSRSLNSDVCVNYQMVEAPYRGKGIFMACKQK